MSLISTVITTCNQKMQISDLQLGVATNEKHSMKSFHDDISSQDKIAEMHVEKFVILGTIGIKTMQCQ